MKNAATLEFIKTMLQNKLEDWIILLLKIYFVFILILKHNLQMRYYFSSLQRMSDFLKFINTLKAPTNSSISNKIHSDTL